MQRKLLPTMLAATLALGAAAVPAAHASKTQESIFQDDNALVSGGDAKRQSSLDDMKALGADTIHSLVFWDTISPGANSKAKPNFVSTDPSSYPPGAFSNYDALVSEAQARGLDVILTPTGGAPLWASGCGRGGTAHHCRPDPVEFGNFVEAVGKRYPTVHRWSIWNEPNMAGWLQPQMERKHGRNIPVAAALYRQLVYHAIAGLQASGHGGDQILLGETAPLGKKTGSLTKRSLAPVPFYQGVFCLDSRGHPLRGSLAKDMGCTGFKRIEVTGVAHHPDNRGGSLAPLSRPDSGEITIANIRTLKSVLSQGSRRQRIRGNLPIYFTEFGFQTNPPDRIFGVSLSRQAAWLNQSDFIAYRDPRVKSVAQYELFDDPVLSTFQTGLRFKDGRAKPSLDGYRLPIWVTRSGSGVRVFGQVRPAHGTPQTVEIQNGNRAFKTVKTVTTSPDGYFLVSVGSQPGPKWRLAWTDPGGTAFTGRSATVSSR
jgi:hypothetical protein